MHRTLTGTAVYILLLKTQTQHLTKTNPNGRGVNNFPNFIRSSEMRSKHMSPLGRVGHGKRATPLPWLIVRSERTM